TVVFMAANVYMGLKTGMTFSSSIPAALIAMGALRAVGGAGVLETNIVQTQASAAGTLCNVILVLPGLVLIGHWHGFPFWETSLVCLIGGWLGVAFSIPLRRALVVEADLPYPEGVAAAEVLKAGEGQGGLRALLSATLVSGILGFATTGLRVLADGIQGSLHAGAAVFRLGTGFSLALVGVGYLVGIGACLALLLGVALAWGIAVPVLTGLGHGAADAVWSDEVRLIGAGIIAVGGIWTVASLAGPILGSVRAAVASARGGGRLADQPRQERDLPIGWVAGTALGLVLPLSALMGWFVFQAGAGFLPLLVGTASVFAILIGFLMAAACGYLAGLLGSSSSPISGIGILTTMLAALLLPLLIGPDAGPEGSRLVVGLALLVASVIVTTASIANDNLQDLKTGRIVDATPWRQQVALGIGVAVGALVIAPLLALLYEAYGFDGALPRDGMDAANALPAPQASLMTQIARGIVGGELPWRMVLIGAGLGAALVALEARLRRSGRSFPALTVGIGMYLPLSVVTTIAAGGVIAWLGTRALHGRSAETVAATRRRGVLLASGFLVGESLVGVLLAGADAVAGRSGALVLVGPGFEPVAEGLGLLIFAVALAATYRLVSVPPAGAGRAP
ncbi:oligopeptide transporter, OPT family, partial [Methylobacterium sp. NEAU 140]|uniref:OPT family oligopeptide transporter n=1 Tax=Methylobacterium sp. NEAU 140 TaxID=3064945 RepID=UPI00273246D2